MKFVRRNKQIIFSIQEHFKNNKNTEQFVKDNFNDFYSYVIPAHRVLGQDTGRCKGGLVQCSRKMLSVRKDRLSTTGWRIQAQILNMPNTRLLWINSYLPTDPMLLNYDDTELLETLAEVESVIINAKCSDILWSGDLNWDFSRNTKFSKTVKSFIDKVGLVKV